MTSLVDLAGKVIGKYDALKVEMTGVRDCLSEGHELLFQEAVKRRMKMDNKELLPFELEDCVFMPGKVLHVVMMCSAACCDDV